MKILALYAVFISTIWAFPKGTDELHFKNVYVDPTIDVAVDLTPRIIGGTEVAPHSIPYQAFLIVTATNGKRWLCGGSLISSKHVLTAGHCVANATSAVIYLGAHNILEQQEDSRIIVHSENLICHEDYNATSISDDIGIIVLDNEILSSEVIDSVALPQDSTDNYEGVSARVSGWGRTGGDELPSAVLLEVNSTVISNNECAAVFNSVIDSQLCISGNGGVGACKGDSGGPLVYNNTLIGIVSYGVKGCPNGYASAFTRVTSYLDWIEEKINATS